MGASQRQRPVEHACTRTNALPSPPILLPVLRNIRANTPLCTAVYCCVPHVSARNVPQASTLFLLGAGSMSRHGLFYASPLPATRLALYCCWYCGMCGQVCCVSLCTAAVPQVYRILLKYTSCVQPISCDEAFLDVTGGRAGGWAGGRPGGRAGRRAGGRMGAPERELEVPHAAPDVWLKARCGWMGDMSSSRPASLPAALPLA